MKKCKSKTRVKLKTKLEATFLSTVIVLSLFSSVTGIRQVEAAGTASDAVSAAVSQVGYYEKVSNYNLDDFTANRGSGNYTKYARDLGITNGQPWCTTFLLWCMNRAGIDGNAYPYTTWVPTMRDWFNARGLFRARGTYTPKAGDFIIFGSGASHVGMVEGVSGGFVHTIEGNTSNNKVERHAFSLSNSYILGYGIVNYSENTKPLDIGNNVCGLILRQDAWKPIRNTGSNVELWGEKGTGDYYWLFKRQRDGSYEIQSMYDGKVLDAWGIGTESGTNVVADKANGGDNQRWYIYSNGTNGFRFVPKHAQNLSLDVAYAGSADGTNIQIHNSNDSVAQRFAIYPVEYKKLTRISIASDYRKNMYVNDKQALKYSLNEVGTTCNMVTWSSSDSSVAAVDSNGQVTAKKAGKVTISCISAYDKSIKDSVSITVQKKPEPTTEKITTERPTTEATTEKVTTEKTTEPATEKATTEKATEPATEKATTGKTTETAVEIPDGKDEEDNIIDLALPKEEGTELTIAKGKCIVEVQSDDVDNPTAVYVQSTNKKAKNIVVPNTVTYAGVTYKITAIEDFAFEGNRKITKVTIGDNVTDIGEEAFAGCKKLTSITIGKSVTTIGKKAFYNCKKLRKIVIKSKKVKKIGKNAFRNTHAKAVIKVPKNKVKNYKKLMKKAGMR